MNRTRWIRAFLVIMAALTMAMPALAQTTAESALLEMREAFGRRQPERIGALLSQVRGHPLEPLALYWHMRLQLETAAPEDIRATLERMAGSYWEDRLRNDWLRVLGKRGDWARFEAERPLFRMDDDRQVQCWGLMLDARAGRLPATEAAEEVRQLWLAQPDADEGCAAAARALRDDGHLGPEAFWQRARLAMEVGKPQVAAQAVSLLDEDWAHQLEAIARDPARFLDDKLTAIRPRTKEMVTLAIIRLAGSDPDAAAQHLERTRWKAQLTEEERSWVWGVIGRRAAQHRRDDALAFFAHAKDHFLPPLHLSWKARAALRAANWPLLLDTIDAMPERMREQPVWVYWTAHAIRAQGRPDRASAEALARSWYASIASPHSYYGQLALGALGRPVTLPPAPARPSAAELRAARANPGLQRALAAFRLGLRSEAAREWHYTVALHTPGGMNDRELLAAATLACERAIWDRCINTSQRTREGADHAQRYPTPHRDTVVRHARAIGLDPAYVYGLIRQESRFVVDARSGVGASGLMQIMPATARWTARKIGLSGYRPESITDHDTNVRLGTAYLKFALDAFDGSLPLAAAAYNAGPGRPRAWRDGPELPAEVWVEGIPFDETRDYVQQVLANTTVYAALLTGQPQRLRDRLGSTIGPRPLNAAADEELP